MASSEQVAIPTLVDAARLPLASEPLDSCCYYPDPIAAGSMSAVSGGSAYKRELYAQTLLSLRASGVQGGPWSQVPFQWSQQVMGFDHPTAQSVFMDPAVSNSGWRVGGVDGSSAQASVSGPYPSYPPSNLVSYGGRFPISSYESIGWSSSVPAYLPAYSGACGLSLQTGVVTDVRIPRFTSGYTAFNVDTMTPDGVSYLESDPYGAVLRIPMGNSPGKAGVWPDVASGAVSAVPLPQAATSDMQPPLKRTRVSLSSYEDETFEEEESEEAEGSSADGQAHDDGCCDNSVDVDTAELIPFLPGVKQYVTQCGERRFACSDPECSEMFRSVQMLCAHLKSAHGIAQPFQCQVPGCRRFLASKAVLSMHMKVHSGVRPYKCTYAGCTAAFGQKSNLKRHSFVHTGERPVRIPPLAYVPHHKFLKTRACACCLRSTCARSTVVALRSRKSLP